MNRRQKTNLGRKILLPQLAGFESPIQRTMSIESKNELYQNIKLKKQKKSSILESISKTIETSKQRRSIYNDINHEIARSQSKKPIQIQRQSIYIEHAKKRRLLEILHMQRTIDIQANVSPTNKLYHFERFVLQHGMFVPSSSKKKHYCYYQ